MLNIKIHPSLCILLFLSLFGGLASKLLIFILIIVLHELGHILVARCFNIKCQSLRLTMLGGMIDLDDYSEKNTFIKIIINSSGIMVNILLILIFKVIKLDFMDNTIVVNYNFLMILINLLPISPLDGYKIFYNILTLFFDDEYAGECMFYLSLIFLSILSILLFITRLYGYYLILSFLCYHTIINKKSYESYKLKQYAFLKGI